MQQTTAYNLELARLERCIKQNICCLVSKNDPLRSNVDRTYYFKQVFLPIYKFYTKYIHAALKYLPFYVFTLHLNLMIFIFFLSPKHNRREETELNFFFHVLSRFSSFFYFLRMERSFIFSLPGF